MSALRLKISPIAEQNPFNIQLNSDVSIPFPSHRLFCDLLSKTASFGFFKGYEAVCKKW